MKLSRTAQFSFSGNKISVEELAEIVSEARDMMAETVTISQSIYAGDYGGSSTTTYIEVEANR